MNDHTPQWKSGKHYLTKKVLPQSKGLRLVPVMDTDLVNFKGEQWKEMTESGYEDYEVSNYGRIKSLSREIELKNGRTVTRAEKILSLNVRKHKQAVLISVKLINSFDKKAHPFPVSRLVYDLFVTPFDWRNKSTTVKKKDGDPLNLNYTNLILEPTGKAYWQPVNQYDDKGLPIKRHDSIQEAAKSLNIPVSQIKDAILHKSLQGKMYYWQRGDLKESIDVSARMANKEKAARAKFRRVQQLTLEGEPLEIFESIIAAGKSLGLKGFTGIQRACANEKFTAFGYRWQYIDENPQQTSTTGTEMKGNHVVTKYNAPVHKYDINGKWKQTYASASVAAKKLKIRSSSISGAISKESKIVNGWYWRQGKALDFIDVSGYEMERARRLMAVKKPVEKLTLDHKPIETYESTTAAANAVGVKSGIISRACNIPLGVCMNFRWRYAPSAGI